MTALKQLEKCVGSMTPVVALSRIQPNGPAVGRMKKLAKCIWNEARSVTQGDEVDRYLCNRGLSLNQYPKILRFHPALGYYEQDVSGKSRKVAEYPAMLACIQGPDGHAVTLHRTYLKDGYKVQLCNAKKVLSGGINGAAVRLFDAGEELAIAEGIETALAIYLSTAKPVWAAISAGNMEKLWLPETVRRVCIYSDNDANVEYDGQACAFSLARRLKKEERKNGRRQVAVFVPRHAGSDWADVWRSRLDNMRQAS